MSSEIWAQSSGDYLADERIPASGVASQMLGTAPTGVRVLNLALAAEGTLADHAIPHALMIIVAQGRIRLTVGETESELGTGAVAYVEPRQVHAVTGIEPSSLLLVISKV